MLTGPWIKTVRNGVCSGRLICSCFEAEQMRMRANPPTYAVNMPLPPPRIGPRTIIAVNGGIDLPTGSTDTDPGGQIHTHRCKQSSLRTTNMRQAPGGSGSDSIDPRYDGKPVE